MRVEIYPRPDRASNSLRLYSVVAPGLERLAAQELSGMGVRWWKEAHGGVEWRGTLRDLYQANLWSSVQSRILLRFASFEASHFTQLSRAMAKLPWELVLPPGHPVRLQVSASGSRLYHTGGIEDAARAGLAEVLRPPLAPRSPSLIFLRLIGDHCTVSIDASGELLHRRGWRADPGTAPLRETLAAALLKVSGWDGTVPLLDPFVGVGTIPIEGAFMAAGLAPGRGRSFAFHEWPCFNRGLWASLPKEKKGPPSPPEILASDRDESALQKAQQHARTAGVDHLIHFVLGEARDVPLRSLHSHVVTDPPLGQRLSESERATALLSLGDLLRHRRGWHTAITSPSPDMPTPLSAKRSLRTVHGGKRVWLLSTNPEELPLLLRASPRGNINGCS